MGQMWFFQWLKASSYFNKADISSIRLCSIQLFGQADGPMGGWANGKNTNTIGRFHTPTVTWSKAGVLKTARRGHGATFNGDVLVVAGGVADGSNHTMKTESCKLNNGTVTCTAEQAAPTLTNYYYYPEMFLVNRSFCETWN